MKLLLILPLLFAAATAHSATYMVDTKLTCTDDKSIIEGLTQIKEQPVAAGKSMDSVVTVVVTMNDSSKEWTIIAIQKSTTCILAAGKDLKITQPKSKNTTNVNF